MSQMIKQIMIVIKSWNDNNKYQQNNKMNEAKNSRQKKSLAKILLEQKGTIAQGCKITADTKQDEKNSNITTLLKLRLLNIKQQRKQAKVVSALLNDYKNKNLLLETETQMSKSTNQNNMTQTKQKQSLKITKIKEILNKKYISKIEKPSSLVNTCRKEEESQTSNLNSIESKLKSKQKFSSIQFDSGNEKYAEKLKLYQASPLHNSTATYVHSYSQAQNKRNYYSCLDKCRMATQSYDQLKNEVITNKTKYKSFNSSTIISENKKTSYKRQQNVDQSLMGVEKNKKDKENKLYSSYFNEKASANLNARELGNRNKRTNQIYCKRGYKDSYQSYHDQYLHNYESKQECKNNQCLIEYDSENKKGKRYMQISVADFMEEDQQNISESISKKFEQWKKLKNNSDYQKYHIQDINDGEREETRDKIEGFNLNQESQIQVRLNKINLSKFKQLPSLKEQ